MAAVEFLFGCKKGETNRSSIHCRRCDSKFMRPGHATLVPHETWMHYDKNGGGGSDDSGVPAGDTDKWFWCVSDMMAGFDNVGVTRPVPREILGAASAAGVSPSRGAAQKPPHPFRYLVCADCECEPVGYQFLGPGANGRCYLSAHRVDNHGGMAGGAAGAAAGATPTAAAGGARTNSVLDMTLVEYRKQQQRKLRAHLAGQMAGLLAAQPQGQGQRQQGGAIAAPDVAQGVGAPPAEAAGPETEDGGGE